MWVAMSILSVVFSTMFGFVLGKMYVIEHDLPGMVQKLITETAKQLRMGEVYCFTLSREPEDDDGCDEEDNPFNIEELQHWRDQ